MATIAVFIALGGSGYAAVTLKKNSVKGKYIARNAITSPKVKDRSLLAQDFKAGQLPVGERGPEGPPGTPPAKAADSELLDGIDSAGFVTGSPSTSSGFIFTTALAAVEGTNTPRRGSAGRWEVWYSCPSPLSSNGTVRLKNLSENSTIDVFYDNGLPDPTHTTLGPGFEVAVGASAAGEEIIFNIQGFGASGRIAHIDVVTVHRPPSFDCHFQMWASETPSIG